MNRIVGIAGGAAAAEQREARVRAALEGCGGEVRVLRPSPELTIGYAGDDALIGRHRPGGDGGPEAVVYGSAYCGRLGRGRARVDDPGSAARLIAERLAGGDPNPSAGLFGSYLGVACEPGARRVRVFGDPSGNRNPFVARHGGELLFASHPLACARLVGPPRLDRRFEDFFLIYGFHPDGRTAVEGVEQVAAAHCAEWTAEGGATAAVPLAARTPPAHDHGDRTPARLIDDLHTLLLECLDDQLCRERRVGVLLGGFDSALVAALLHRAGKEVTTYSFRYADASYNQAHTETLRAHLGTRHVWVDVEPEALAADLAAYGERYVQPTNWMNYVVQTSDLVAGRAHADGIRHLYSGDGCDALFLGFPGTYQRTRIFARLPRLPRGMVRLLVALASRPGLERRLGHPYRMALNVLRATGRDMPARAFMTFRVFDELSLRQMRGAAAPAQAEPVEETIRRISAPHAGATLQRIGYVSKGLVSPSKIKQLGITDLHGSTIHAPYMHPEIKAFLGTVPDELLRGATQSSLRDLGKGLLIEAARRHELLPEAIISQPKISAVDSPVDHWYGHQLRPAAEELLAHLPFSPPARYLEGLFRESGAERLYKEHLGSTRVASDTMSLLVTYASLCRAIGTAAGSP